MERADVVIIGGGIIGFSIAYHLLCKAPGTRVIVLEREITPGMGATGKATGGLRYQFSTRINIQLTQLAMPEYLRFEAEFGVDMGLVKNGYLFVTGQESQLATMKANAALQQEMGAPTRVLDAADLARLVPAMRTDDLLGGTICPEDATANPYSALEGYWKAARRLGAELRTETEVTGLVREGDRLTAVETNRGPIACGAVVNAAGPWAGLVGGLAGLDVPVQAYKRQVFIASPMPELGQGMPLTVDIDTGWYVHRENGSGQLYLGGTDKVSHPGFSTAVDWDGLERVVAAGMHRFPVLEKAEIGRSYAGLREITPDFHAIVDRALENFYLACGFSGHGFMHAPAAGILIAELMLEGAARSLDITPLRLSRFAAGLVRQELNSF